MNRDFVEMLDALSDSEAEFLVVGAHAGRAIPVLGREDLIQNKTVTGRPQDLADVARLLAEDRPPHSSA